MGSNIGKVRSVPCKVSKALYSLCPLRKWTPLERLVQVLEVKTTTSNLNDELLHLPSCTFCRPKKLSLLLGALVPTPCPPSPILMLPLLPLGESKPQQRTSAFSPSTNHRKCSDSSSGGGAGWLVSARLSDGALLRCP